jgi:hypothetical protein
MKLDQYQEAFVAMALAALISLALIAAAVAA